MSSEEASTSDVSGLLSPRGTPARSTSSLQATDPYGEALSVYRRGRVGEALSILGRSTTGNDARSLLLRARVAIATSPSVALTALRDARLGGFAVGERAEAAMLRGRAHAQLADFAAAQQCFSIARHLIADADGHAALSSEIDLCVAAMMVDQSRFDEAERAALALIGRRPSSQTAGALRILARVAFHRGQPGKYGVYLLQALKTVSSDAIPDIQLWAVLVRDLAHLLEMVPTADVHDAVMHHLGALPWTEDLAEAHASVYAHLGTRAILDGAFVRAYGLFNRASAVAQTELQRMSLLLDRAEIAEWLGEPVSAEGQLLEATVIAQQFEWATAPQRPCWRSVLLALAHLHAPRDGTLALAFAGQFEEIGGFGASAVPGVYEALKQYLLGSMHVALGQRRHGIEMLEVAHAHFVRLRYGWRAGQAAIVLSEATGSTSWRARARAHLAHYPASFLARRLSRLDVLDRDTTHTMPTRSNDDGRVRALTPAQRMIYFALLEGLSVHQIAADLDRSDRTVSNHIQAIFRKFGVKSRAALRAS